ncbi:MAG: phosphate ABC transporter substrate-binding protein [Thermodesulfobacteriota bacterium]
MKIKTLLALSAALFCLLISADGAFAGVTVVVNIQNPVSSISRRNLSNIYKLKKKSWDTGGIIDAVNLPQGDPLREKFSGAVLHKGSAAMEKYYLKNALSGKGQPPRTASSSEEVKEIVKNNSNAVGYIDSSEVDSSVKVLPVDGARQIE